MCFGERKQLGNRGRAFLLLLRSPYQESLGQNNLLVRVVFNGPHPTAS